MFNNLFLILTGLILFTGCFVTEAPDETADASTTGSSSGIHLRPESSNDRDSFVDADAESSEALVDDAHTESSSSEEEVASSDTESQSSFEYVSSTEAPLESSVDSYSSMKEIVSSDATNPCELNSVSEECTADENFENTLARCTDGVDNDSDGTTDCDDIECWIIPGTHCRELTAAICSDGLDNDSDGKIDCDDTDCLLFEDICPFSDPGSGGGSDGSGGGTGGGTGDGTGPGGGGAGVGAECDGETLVLDKFTRFTMTVYDHDRNSDFGNGVGADELRQGMVTDTLVDGRPEFKANLWNNTHIGQWWSEDYAVSVTEVELPFAKLGVATYSYTDQDFFPLDDASAKEGDSGLNYYFAGHLQWEFTYDGQGNQYFYFSGDDDVFVYINGNLILDIGGVHTPKEDEFYLDTELAKLGLGVGDDITLDFFIADRQMAGSQAFIQFTIPCIVKQ